MAFNYLSSILHFGVPSPPFPLRMVHPVPYRNGTVKIIMNYIFRLQNWWNFKVTSKFFFYALSAYFALWCHPPLWNNVNRCCPPLPPPAITSGRHCFQVWWNLIRNFSSKKAYGRRLYGYTIPPIADDQQIARTFQIKYYQKINRCKKKKTQT